LVGIGRFRAEGMEEWGWLIAVSISYKVEFAGHRPAGVSVACLALWMRGDGNVMYVTVSDAVHISLRGD
jgi:hypothetical protein